MPRLDFTEFGDTWSKLLNAQFVLISYVTLSLFRSNATLKYNPTAEHRRNNLTSQCYILITRK